MLRNKTNKIKLILFLIPTLLIPIFCNGQITSISGNIIDNNQIIINGIDFGSGPTVEIFDDFEKGINGDNISTGTGSAKYGEWNVIGEGIEKYSDSYSVSGDLSFMADYSTTWRNFISKNLQNSREIFFSWWQFVPTDSNWPGENTTDGMNWKIMWVLGPDTTHNDIYSPVILETSALFGSNDQSPGYHKYIDRNHFKKGEWLRQSVYFKGSTTSTSNDGKVYYWYTNETGHNNELADNTANNLKESGGWSILHVNGYGRQTPNCRTYMDDVYIASGDNARARVEIGNSSNYNDCTNLVILTPTSWSDTSITATINQGSFQPGEQAYLYVIDSNGNISNGYPITIGQSSTIRADVNQDNQITSTDAMLTLRKSLNMDMSQTNWQDSPTTGDVNCDNTVNSTDAMLILRKSLGLDMTGTGWCIN